MTKENIIETLVAKNLKQDEHIRQLEKEGVELRKELRKVKLERASLLLCIKDSKAPIRANRSAIRATTDRIYEAVLKVADEGVKTIDDIKKKDRHKEIAEARFLAMYLMKEFTNMSYKNIGREFGGRDHTTVIYACRTIKNLMETDDLILDKVNACIKNLTPQLIAA